MSPGSGITVDGVWKKFRRGERHDSLRDLLPSLVRGLARRRPDPATLQARDFWALRDVSFEIKPGQAMGIIGHNGAGKSTLLKLITRIMRPTLGRCEVRGRVGALIELAAGFHPDLTGRENVYLQGAIMGMPTAATRRKFDEIVAFSGIADFIDTPVKRYSSGMNARLGFSIAAHLDPDVLIIDEVLSVGDLAFQERAFGRMQEIVQSGIPVAVVSHQLDRVRTLCTEAILLEAGTVVRRGDPEECIAEYVQKAAKGEQRAVGRIPGLTFDAIGMAGKPPFRSGQRGTLRISGGWAREEGQPRSYDFGFKIRSLQTGQRVYETRSSVHGVKLSAPGPFEFRADLQLNLPEGLYQVESWVNDGDRGHFVGDGPMLQFLVEKGPPFMGQVQLNPVMTVQQDQLERS
ncbi:MAG TPA: ABC transporter ATP-binding protein [Gemmatimonadales bacterium]|nr:ABC transporter ATP-binding protein [Gemmatimonadales bacterium]